MSAVEDRTASDSMIEFAARLQALEDMNAIRALFIEYGKLADTKDWAGISELFADGGTFGFRPIQSEP